MSPGDQKIDDPSQKIDPSRELAETKRELAELRREIAESRRVFAEEQMHQTASVLSNALDATFAETTVLLEEVRQQFKDVLLSLYELKSVNAKHDNSTNT